MNKIFIIVIGLIVMLVCSVGVVYEKLEKVEDLQIKQINYIEKIPLYYNLDDPTTAYIKNSKGDYEEVIING